MFAFVEFVCQRCREGSLVPAALKPPAIQPCPKCEGNRQAVRLVSGREARKAVRLQRPA